MEVNKSERDGKHIFFLLASFLVFFSSLWSSSCMKKTVSFRVRNNFPPVVLLKELSNIAKKLTNVYA